MTDKYSSLFLSHDISLQSQDVHVWHLNLNQIEQKNNNKQNLIQTLLAILSVDELERVIRFYYQEHRENFILVRGYLRIVLSHYLHIEPEQIQFKYSDRGKPYLDQSLAINLQFNLSHSHGYAVYAISLGRELGIDIEYICDRKPIQELTKRFFLPDEQAIILALSLELQQQAFFIAWTYKEAYGKATGEGLVQGLAKISVASVLRDHAHSLLYSPWLLNELKIDPQYATCLAVKGQDWQIKLISLTEHINNQIELSN